MIRLPLVKGTLDLLVLRALSWTPMHGFEVVTWLERAAHGALEVEDSALYQAAWTRSLFTTMWRAVSMASCAALTSPLAEMPFFITCHTW